VAAVCRALNSAIGERAFAGAGRALTMHAATGVKADGTQWSSVFNQNGGWGATRDGDADGGQKGITSNYMDLPVEAAERTIPALIMRKEYVPDSGGGGRFRGGPGSTTDAFFLEPSECYVSTNHIRSAPGDGTFGGRDGMSDAVWMWEPKSDGEPSARYLPLDDTPYHDSTPVAGRLDPDRLHPSPTGKFFHWGSRPVWATPAGAMWRSITAGGGGWGAPLTRAPAAVARDVRDGYVSVEGAARDYGVVVVGDPENDPEGVGVDEPATGALRAEARKTPPPAVELAHDGSTVATPVEPVERESVDAMCENCGSDDVARYPVLAEDGWTMVEKCQSCLHSVSRVPWRRLGYVPAIEDHL
jgi:N-methylhydantoinase B